MMKTQPIILTAVDDAITPITSTYENAAAWGNSVAIGMIAIMMAIGIINFLLYKD